MPAPLPYPFPLLCLYCLHPPPHREEERQLPHDGDLMDGAATPLPTPSPVARSHCGERAAVEWIGAGDLCPCGVWFFVRRLGLPMRVRIERNRRGHDGGALCRRGPRPYSGELLGFSLLCPARVLWGGTFFFLCFHFTENLLARSGYLIPLIDFRSEWARRSGNLPSPGADELDPAPATVVSRRRRCGLRWRRWCASREYRAYPRSVGIVGGDYGSD